MDGRRWRKECTKLLAGTYSHRHKTNLFVGCYKCLVLFLAEEKVHITLHFSCIHPKLSIGLLVPQDLTFPFLV